MVVVEKFEEVCIIVGCEPRVGDGVPEDVEAEQHLMEQTVGEAGVGGSLQERPDPESQRPDPDTVEAESPGLDWSQCSHLARFLKEILIQPVLHFLLYGGDVRDAEVDGGAG